MPRINPRYVDPIEKSKYLDILWTSIAGLNTRQEVKDFFKDLLSVTEAVMLGRRLVIAKMLLEGAKYEEIIKEHKVGDDTIGRVQQWLTSGFGGYEKALEAFENALEKRKEAERVKNIEPYSFEWLKRKYPLHFLLFNLFDRSPSNERSVSKSYKKQPRKK